jgi:hypothetical protein
MFALKKALSARTSSRILINSAGVLVMPAFLFHPKEQKSYA